MTAVLPRPVSLEGPVVSLAPMTHADIPELFHAIGRKEVFTNGYGGGIAALPRDLPSFERFIESYYLEDQPSVAWTVRGAGHPAGRVVGATWLGEFDLRNESTHVGATAFDPEVWGTAVNAATKLLVLGFAFDQGFGRVRIQADSANARSRGAIERLGARFEGALRRDQRRADGTWRDTAVYSVLADEWPAVKAGLVQRIASTGSQG
ncbi:GNAT family N-acetyltransferase [Agromyces sp. S2-1-8]|uniref:GNAT family N-acetyltransferase n=1 Tax=Agromyces sp. S2-1-8 TaxID=2897180 RepID=UPI001E46383A|nr:GNAT family protein [Agromyces sp. S2-1-8]MCD5345695.1 GNAT family N-acetyltransferase [Agromyces sp. S2-1-8]